MSEAQAVAPPSADEARGWIGCRVDDVAGKGVGRADGLFVDAASREPAWLVVRSKRSRFSSSLVVVPLADCARGAGCVWVAHESRAIRSSPLVDAARPLLREHELTICAHYDIGEHVGRAAEVAGRAEGSVTSQPG